MADQLPSRVRSENWERSKLASPPMLSRRAALGAIGASLLCGSSVFAAGWVERWNWKGINFRSAIPLRNIGVSAQELVTLRETIEKHLQLPKIEGTVNVTVFGSHGDFKAYLRKVAPAATNRQALYMRTERADHVYCYNRRGVATNLRHELTHAWMHQAATFVPTWLDEGIASYYQAAGDDRPWQEPHLRNIRWRARFGDVPAIASLEKVVSIQQMKSTTYRDCWSWVHFLLHESAASLKTLRDFFAIMESGNVPDPLSVAAPKALGDVKARYLKHFRNWE